MKKTFAVTAAMLALGLAGCESMHTMMHGEDGAKWTTLFDGRSLENFTAVGDANWRIEDGAVVADKGTGFLVAKGSYEDFEIRAEFWADDDANSGVFIRCEDRVKLTSDVCYEVNIFDKRPVAIYGTGAIVDVGKVLVDPPPKAGGHWNTYEITAKGYNMTVRLNGVKTSEATNSRHARGAIGLQYAPGVVKDKGVIKFRKVEIRPL
ncbi:MAG: 3-keto-disaccharide hydrolase [Usitatibacter sp.]